MAKRLLVLLVLSLVLPATALAATVHVRIEGKTQTLFAPHGGHRHAQETRSTRSSRRRSPVSSTTTSRVELRQLRRPGRSLRRHRLDSGWVFKVNNVSPPVGADQVQLKDGDHVLWYYATFGPTGGPPTLEVKACGQGLLHGDRVRRQRQGRGGDRSRLARRLEADRVAARRHAALPGAASRRARARDGDRRRPLERREVRVARRPRCSRSSSPVAAGAGASTGRRRSG